MNWARTPTRRRAQSTLRFASHGLLTFHERLRRLAARQGRRRQRTAPFAAICCFVLLSCVNEIRQISRRLGAAENGKPVAYGGGGLAAEWARYYGGWADKIGDELVEPTLGGRALDYVRKEPVGVVGVMTPFNSPLNIAAMTVLPALAAGNCVVLKAPDVAPFHVRASRPVVP